MIGVLQSLLFPDLGPSPLFRGWLTPVWFGLFPKEGQAFPGLLIQLQDAVQQYCNNLVRQGLLASRAAIRPWPKRDFAVRRRGRDIAFCPASSG